MIREGPKEIMRYLEPTLGAKTMVVVRCNYGTSSPCEGIMQGSSGAPCAPLVWPHPWRKGSIELPSPQIRFGILNVPLAAPGALALRECTLLRSTPSTSSLATSSPTPPRSTTSGVLQLIRVRRTLRVLGLMVPCCEPLKGLVRALSDRIASPS